MHLVESESDTGSRAHCPHGCQRRCAIYRNRMHAGRDLPFGKSIKG